MAAAPKHKLILASASLRRLDLLKQINVTPARIEPTEIDETPLKGERPRLYAERMALNKAMAAADKSPDALILAADTVVAVGRRIIGKPSSEAEARQFLGLLSGRQHRVITAVALQMPGKPLRLKTSVTSLAFKRLTAAEIDAYIESGEWQGKAGAYAIQGLAGAFVRRLGGSYSNVVGLPLFETAGLLKWAGYDG
ncbi:MAG: nucleoside triphosphate pyrophosphatase [Sphingomonadales bacterium]